MADRPPITNSASIAAIEATPLTERAAGRTPYALIKAQAEQRPDAIALDFASGGQADAPAETLSYGALFRRICQAARAFEACGARAGRPVAYLLPNLPETHITLWAGTAVGGAAPINPFLKAEQIAEILAASGAGTMVAPSPDFDAALWDKAVRAAARVGVETLIAVRGDAPDGAHGFEALLARHADAPLDQPGPPGSDAAYFHTGGTTGAPKLARQTGWNQAAMAEILKLSLDLTPEDVVLTGLPLFHANAALLTGLAPLAAGSRLVLAGADGFRDKAAMSGFWALAEQRRVTVFSGVPTIYASLLEHPIGARDLSALRYGLVGAAPMPVALFDRFEAATGIKILELYGMTETTCVATCNPRDGERKIGSIGLRVPYVETRIVRLDEAGAYAGDAAQGEAGVLAMKGPVIIPGYKQAEHNARLWAGEGWLISGDLARIDEAGYVWLTGRAKDLIIRSGHNIDPQMIEEALHRHPDVELAAAIGKPDAYAGELPVAYVVRKPGAEVSEDALLAHARETVAERPAVPKEIVFIDAMPVTAVGKIFKPALREDAAVRAVQAILDDLSLKAQVSARTEKKSGLVVTVITDPEAELAALKERLAGLPIACDINP